MKFVTEVEQAVQKYAKQYGVPVDLVRAIVQTESSGWTDKRTRYEPGFFKWLVDRIRLTKAEYTARSTSYGPMQVLGQTARELGYNGSFADLHTVDTGIKYGCKYLARLMNKYYTKYGWPGVIAAYNAGSPIKLKSGEFMNQVYVNKVTRNWKV